ncbi:hypothetical protein [Serratia sp. OS31]|uniref:hypothetical protein n=1 Tax=Serratia sp. OS31 TaxID=2760844 RepID=UPI0016015DA4|nr:hypothetical protein [Serratia sp. OS31]MBB1584614.1 hypothetical protein [Serratia sp. OS31]
MKNDNIENSKSLTSYLFVYGMALIVGAAFYFYVSEFFLAKLFEYGVAKAGTRLQEAISILKWYPSMFTLSIGVAFVFTSFFLDILDVVACLIKTGWERLLVLAAKRGNESV